MRLPGLRALAGDWPRRGLKVDFVPPIKFRLTGSYRRQDNELHQQLGGRSCPGFLDLGDGGRHVTVMQCPMVVLRGFCSSAAQRIAPVLWDRLFAILPRSRHFATICCCRSFRPVSGLDVQTGVSTPHIGTGDGVNRLVANHRNGMSSPAGPPVCSGSCSSSTT